MWDDLLEIALELVGSILGDVTQDTSIPRGIRCTIQVISGIVLIGIAFLLGYLWGTPTAMTVAGVASGIIFVITTILVIRNWRKGEK